MEEYCASTVRAELSEVRMGQIMKADGEEKLFTSMEWNEEI
jgi:hypothetical protein